MVSPSPASGYASRRRRAPRRLTDQHALLLVALLVGCGGGDDTSGGGGGEGGSDGGGGTETQDIALSSLQSWTRLGDPVLRDPLVAENYEVASDAHVFRDEAGGWAMIYTGDVSSNPGMRLARGSAPDTWTIEGTLLEGVGPSGLDSHRETSFYRHAKDGTHQIYYIGYDDEQTYQSQIYLAEAASLEGPYTIGSEPVVARGLQAGLDVYLMTSPSVVEHEGRLYMVYVGWDASPSEVTEVWSLGAISDDDGRTWGEIQQVDVPIMMEGQLSVGPDGAFYAVSTGETAAGEGLFLARASHPFGPYERLEEPILSQAGPPWEVTEITAAQIYFEPSTRTAYLNYTGADQAKGWWLMLATTSY